MGLAVLETSRKASLIDTIFFCPSTAGGEMKKWPLLGYILNSSKKGEEPLKKMLPPI